MEYINNFRYGEISRKLAGSFDKEAYQQGCFTYRNMLTDSFGTATRRPPLRKIISTTGILDIREFKLSESVQYLVGLKEKKYVIFRYVLGELTEITEGGYPHRIDEPEIALTSTMAREIRSAQYYERMYFVHHSFRPFYIEIVPSTDTANSSYMEVLINQDAKGTYFFTPSYVTDAFGKELTNLEGRLVYKKEDAEGNVTWWFDYEMKEEQYEYALTYPPVQGQSSQISYYEDYPDDNLMLGEGNFPSVIAIINDSMYLAATDKCPSTMWKSRILGSSQYIEEYTVESLHDFIQFQLMATETQSMVDADKLPKTEMKDSYGEVLYEEGIYGEKYFVPEKDSDGNYTYKTELFWKPDDVNSETGTYYYERSGDQFSKPYDEDKYGAPIKKPLMTYDLSASGVKGLTEELYYAIVHVARIVVPSHAVRRLGDRLTLEEVFAHCGQELEIMMDEPDSSASAGGIYDELEAYVDSHFTSSDLSQKLLSDMFGISTKSISLHYSGRYGMTYIEYVTGLRIGRAKELLLSPEVSIERAAELSGYQNTLTFRRNFKDATGLTPSEYRGKFRV